MKVSIRSGLALSRVLKSSSVNAKTYKVYGISELREDLGISPGAAGSTKLSTEQDLPVLQGGELVMSLISPTAGFVRSEHAGYVLSQNFIQLTPEEDLDPGYLAFLLNESHAVKKQIQTAFQNSTGIEKVQVSTIKNLHLPPLPDLKTQQLIGKKYTLELQLKQLKDRRNELSLKKAIEEIRRIADDGLYI